MRLADEQNFDPIQSYNPNDEAYYKVSSLHVE
jgi:hypothetical protein